jgi:hypothetical protein
MAAGQAWAPLVRRLHFRRPVQMRWLNAAFLCGPLAGCSSSTAPSPLEGPDAASIGPDAALYSEVGSPPDAAIPDGKHVVRPCTPDGGLGAGTWANITPPQVSLTPDGSAAAGTSALVLDPQDSATVYLGTGAQGIYKSTDCGSTWIHVNTGQNGSVLDQGSQWTLQIDPADSNILYTNAGYDNSGSAGLGIFKSTNGGVDWDHILPPQIGAFTFGGFVHEIEIDPTNPQHVLLSPHFDCADSATGSCFLETMDGALTWNVVENAPSSGEESGFFILNSDTWFWALGFGGMQKTTDHGATWSAPSNANGYAFADIVVAPDGTFYAPAAFNVIQSKDGIAWTQVTNSPGAWLLASSATTMYASGGAWGGNPTQVAFLSAAFSAPTSWTQLPPKPAATTYGAAFIQYDSDHRILYTSDGYGGAWRLVTE